MNSFTSSPNDILTNTLSVDCSCVLNIIIFSYHFSRSIDNIGYPAYCLLGYSCNRAISCSIFRVMGSNALNYDNKTN